MKSIFILAILVLLAIPLISAQEIWSFNNFLNKYKVYGSATCDINKTKPCPNELSWQGKSIKFKFNLNSLEGLSDTLKFKFNVVYYTNYGKNKDAILDIKVKKYSTRITVNKTGLYSVEIPKSQLKIGKNTIQIKGTNINVGYGKYTPTVVLNYVSFENS